MPAPTRFDHQTGWTQLDRFLSPADVAEITADCERLLQLPLADRLAGDKPASGTRHLVQLDRRSKVVAEIVERQRLLQLVREILDGPFQERAVGYRNPQPEFGGQRLHADDVPKLDDSPARVATAIIALTTFTETNGSTRVLPGSHRRPDLQRQSGSLTNHTDELPLTGPTGTAFVLSGHLLHSGTKNKSDSPRPALQVVWRR